MRRLFLLLSFLLSVWLPTTVLAFEDSTLAAAAAQYQQLIRDSRSTEASGQDAAAFQRRAERYARQKLWNEAIADYEKTLVAGSDTSAVWFRLAQSWQQLNTDESRERAQQAAFNAYQRADNAAEQARALYLLGDVLEPSQPKQTLAAWREALGLEENPQYAERYQKLVEAHAFRINGLNVEADSATPSVCLQFSEALQGGRQVNYADYLVIEPAVKAAVSARDDRLCIEGVSHGQSYQIQVRSGLPAASGDRLTAEASFSADVGDRSPNVGFRGATYVLPRNGGQGLPLTTVNVETVQVRVLRINDRNLMQQINNQRVTNSLDGYDIEDIADRSGEALWTGTMTIEGGERNQEVTTAVPMNEVLTRTEPGIYIVTAQSADGEIYQWSSRATQWLVVTDLGLSTIQGDDGLHVFVRSLDSALPLANVELRLYARNNGELGTSRTDASGHALFDPGLLRGEGGRSPAALMAYSRLGSMLDFNYLDLTYPTFDLSDRGVDGRAAPGPVDVYLYSERGVYRPGEAVELMALVRDSSAKALTGLPLTLKLFRPDEVEAEQRTLTQEALGGFHTTIALADNARTGRWTVRAYTDPKGTAVGELSFSVEDFVPQRIKLELDSAAKALAPGETIAVKARGRFLYGAPAALLNTQAEIVLRVDPEPYPAFKNYQFGLVQESYEAERFELTTPATDEAGEALLDVSLDAVPDTTRPLKAVVRVSLFEPGGRPVNQVLGLPYRTQPYALGIRPRFNGSVPIGQAAGFDVVAVGPDGQPRAVEGLRYELFREEYNYYWFYQSNRWDYKLIIRDSDPVASRTLALTAEPQALTQPGLDWGNYRLEIHDPTTGVASSVRFDVGWFVNPSADDTPDKLQVTLDKPVYQAGDTARVYVKAPFAGEVLLAVAGNTLHTTKSFSLSADGTTVELPVDADWGPGVYVTATAFRPGNNTTQRGPGRAIGLAWLKLDPAPRTLEIAMQTPAEVLPRQTIQLPVQVNGAQPGESLYLTLAAVDEGILQLTDFVSPNPLDYYLGKRQLGVELLDIYGRLIEVGGRPGQLRSGGDGFGRQLDGSAVRTVKTVALFSGPLAVGADGKVTIPLELPDFNGELRLMAVAWNQTQLGKADTPLLVRDPLVARAYLPRFLAPGDSGQLTLSVQNLSAAPGEYRVRLTTEGAVELADNREFVFSVSDSKVQNRAEQPYTLRGLTPGVGHIRMQVDGPGGLALTRDWEIGVRPAQAYTSTRTTRRLPPGETLRLDRSLYADYLPGTVEAKLSVATRPNLNVPTLLKQLDRYPYGCLEQTTSRALPLLYFNQVAQAWIGEQATETVLRQRVQDAIQRILTMQRYEGGFGLWNPDSPAEYWLTAYALDFLSRARADNYLVPETPYNRGLDWLAQQLADSGYDGPALAARAYALYVLARAERAAIGDLRYLHDNYLLELPTSLARAQLGAALARYGDMTRAREAFAAAQETAGTRPNYYLHDYGTELRDQAALVALGSEAGLLDAGVLETLAAKLAEQLNERVYTSTQEQVWLLLAANSLLTTPATLQLDLNGKTLPTASDPFYLSSDTGEIERGVALTNQGQQPLWYVLDTSGIPSADQPAEQNGFAITRRYYNRAGEPVDLNQVSQNEMLVVLITGQAQGDVHHQALVVDLLPAGLEIENARLANNASADDLDWLPALSETLNTELRDDRFVVALDLDTERREFALAYLVRAVTPGIYRLPAIYIEDMYKPWYFARGTLDKLRVK